LKNCTSIDRAANAPGVVIDFVLATFIAVGAMLLSSQSGGNWRYTRNQFLFSIFIFSFPIVRCEQAYRGRLKLPFAYD
jgi:hypothetical protein